MTTEKIKEFVERGLLTNRILIEATGVKKSAISNRLNYGWKFQDEEIKTLRELYWPLMRELYPDLFSHIDNIFESTIRLVKKTERKEATL